MSIELTTPTVAGLTDVIDALREWQHDRAPMQLHPGDVGWFWRFGVAETAAAIRAWSEGGRVLAVGLLDGKDLLRMTIAPDVYRDDRFARRLADDLRDPSRGVLPEGAVHVETPNGVLLRELLAEEGWDIDEQWMPLRHDLAQSFATDSRLRFEVVTPELAGVRVALHRTAFDRSSLSEADWQAMASGPQYTDARCLVAYDEHGTAVAAVTVWSAGEGRPGLVEPMGVHRDHRGQGYGTAITVAAAAALRELGSSSAIVCTPSSNVGAVATYRAAGFEPQPERRDLCRRPRRASS